MHLLTEQSTTVERPVSSVFSYVSDMERFGEWFPAVLSIASVDDLPPGQVGKRYHETVSIPFVGRRKIELVVRECQRDRRFVTEGQLTPLLPRMEISIAATDANSSQVTWRMFSRNRSTLARVLILPLARRVLTRRAHVAMSRLKHNLESTGTVG